MGRELMGERGWVEARTAEWGTVQTTSVCNQDWGSVCDGDQGSAYD